jgi:hypothetical protein
MKSNLSTEEWKALVMYYEVVVREALRELNEVKDRYNDMRLELRRAKKGLRSKQTRLEAGRLESSLSHLNPTTRATKLNLKASLAYLDKVANQPGSLNPASASLDLTGG